MQTGCKDWINLREYKDIQKIDEGHEVLLGFEDDQISEAKEREIQNWIDNEVYDEVEDEGQKAVSARWVITEQRN